MLLSDIASTVKMKLVITTIRKKNAEKHKVTGS